MRGRLALVRHIPALVKADRFADIRRRHAEERLEEVLGARGNLADIVLQLLLVLVIVAGNAS